MEIRWRGTYANSGALPSGQADDYAQNTDTGTIWSHDGASWSDTTLTTISLLSANDDRMSFVAQELSSVVNWNLTYGSSDYIVVRKGQDQEWTIGKAQQAVTGVPADLTAVDSSFNIAAIKE
jgi:hypothetical protein